MAPLQRWPALLIAIHLIPSAVHAQLVAACRTSDYRPGRCVRLRSCASLQLAAQQAADLAQLVTLYAYVRRSLCGYDGAALMVCCTDGLTAAQSLDTVIPIAADGGGSSSSDNDGNADGLQFYEPFTFVPLQPTAAPPAPTPQPTVAAVATPLDVQTVQPMTVAPPIAIPVPQDTVCGVSNFTQTRVVGGANAKLNAYPWIGILAYQLEPTEPPKYLCASSLITAQHSLTTAHCIRDELAYVRLGEHDLSSDADGATPLNVPIIARTTHPDYVANLILNDIALLRLAFAVPIGPQIRPICLPTAEPLRSADLTGYQPFLAGWGSASYQGAAPAVLQEAQVPIVAQEQCARNYRQLFAQQTFDGRTLCAGEGGRDACQGDSGGPLMLPQQVPGDRSFYYVLIGLVSYGYECARPGFPGVYTRVSAFMPWIEGNIGV